MTSTFLPTPPSSAPEAARDMADVLMEIERVVADNADQAEVFRRIVEDGGDPQAVEGLVLHWLELLFSHLIGLMSILPSAKHHDHYELIVADGSYRLAVDIPDVLRDVQEGWWS